MRAASAEQKNVLIPTLSDADIRHFEAVGEQRSVAPGEVIQDSDSVVSGIFIVLAGSVELLGAVIKLESLRADFGFVALLE